MLQPQQPHVRSAVQDKQSREQKRVESSHSSEWGERHGEDRWSLAEEEVHVWYAELELSESSWRSFARVLSPDERCRAERFRNVRDQKCFVGVRAVLRCLLARYVGVAPEALRFRYGHHGKPDLIYPEAPTLRFNISHSHCAAAWAFTPSRDIGIDLEQVRLMPDLLSIADAFFSERERTVLSVLTTDEQASVFFHWWTQKEALLKATGEGLIGLLSQIELGSVVAPQHSISFSFSPLKAAPWVIHDLTLIPGYAAAVAVAGPVGSLSCRVLPEWLLREFGLPLLSRRV